MKKRIQKIVKVFDTKYKKGEKLLCIKDVIWDGKTLFNKGEIYIVHHIEYSKCDMGNKTTKYKPFYIINEKGFCSPYEDFTDNEETIGAMGMSGYGHIDAHFKSI